MASLGDAVTGSLSALRNHAESMMVDACQVTREGASRFDRRTGKTVRDVVDVYAGACRVRMVDAQTAQLNGGLVDATTQMSTLSLPVERAGVVRVGDVVTVTACPYAPHLVGRRLVIDSVPSGTLVTACRFRVREIAP